MAAIQLQWGFDLEPSIAEFYTGWNLNPTRFDGMVTSFEHSYSIASH